MSTICDQPIDRAEARSSRSYCLQSNVIIKKQTECNPILWQDTREGYLRNRALRVCDIALDNIGTVPGAQLIDTYYPGLDSLLVKIRDGKEFKVLQQPKKNYQINYFHSSSRP